MDGIPGAGDSVTLSGNTNGAGILIVRNADMILTGTFRWEGLIIVSGSEISLKATMSSSTAIFGSIMVSEAGNPAMGAIALDLQGSFRSAFSRTALNAAAGLIPGGNLGALYASLPAYLTQNYWRSVNP